MDDDLGLRFRSGDPAAVRDLYLRYSGAVFTVAMALLGDPELAAEAVQLTFLNAWRAATRFDPSRKLAPWLYAIARRAAVDTYRREKGPTRGGHHAEVEVAVEDPAIEHAWEAWQVRLAVDSLPDEEREVVRLQHFSGLTHREIAQRLGHPLGTVKSRSHRAHRRLARLLSHVRGEAP